MIICAKENPYDHSRSSHHRAGRDLCYYLRQALRHAIHGARHSLPAGNFLFLSQYADHPDVAGRERFAALFLAEGHRGIPEDHPRRPNPVEGISCVLILKNR